MKGRVLLLITLLWLGVVSFGHAEAKAYELVKYRAKVAGVTIAFDFADGYSEASELRVTDAATGKTTRFLMENSDKMLYLPEKAGGAVKSVTLKVDLEARAPASVSGSYLRGEKSVPFTLKKSK